MPASIADYALVGDGKTCALIARTGSVDFLCWPRFDSGACFAAMLGDDSHGHWRLAPEGFVTATTRRYRGDTLVLETEFTTEHGAVRVIDFMPRDDMPGSALIRIVEGVRGTVRMDCTIRLRFDYGDMPPWSQQQGNGFLAEVGPDRVALFAPIPVAHERASGTARFEVAAGQRLPFALVYTDATDPLRAEPDAERALAETEREWSDWIGRFDKPCHWPGPVKRSLITLRALIHKHTGGLLAAATLGLPEQPGGSMNWDYRYCWLRDATFTLTALLNAGYTEEARKWRDWILRAIAGSPERMQIMYRLDGTRRLPEYEATWLPGYEGARPVLVGNAASNQIQLDVYGELLDGFHVADRAGIDREPRCIEVETALIEYLEGIWDKPSADIWETRGDPKRYVYSQVMAWVGIDRFLAAARKHGHADPALVQRLGPLRQTMHDAICARGYDAEHGHFVRDFGGSALDASLLILPLVGFLPADDPRMAGTIRAVETQLMEGGLVRRMPAKGDGRDEGAFLACSFWLADCMKLQGRAAESRALLERVIALSNDVGLLSEEYHVPSRRLIGNTPQALTHLGLVNTALSLSGPVLQRGA
ncbi:glycoside hydrolase family 15 protein [Methylobacterium phyllostachyos]|nr:glycoside hydrolase family 15 protein [Methylobacterium phyllostachyos]